MVRPASSVNGRQRGDWLGTSLANEMHSIDSMFHKTSAIFLDGMQMEMPKYALFGATGVKEQLLRMGNTETIFMLSQLLQACSSTHMTIHKPHDHHSNGA